jgi:endonuclease/exonuclease/phosphatase family metal-dependent hydrolase
MTPRVRIGRAVRAASTALLAISLLTGCVRRLPDAAGPAPTMPTMPCRGIVDARGTPTDERVTWHVAPDPHDRALLGRSCAVVGPAVIAHPATPVEASVVALDDLAIVTWNVHADAGDIRAFVESIRAGQSGQPRRPHIVLLLQETYRAGALVPAHVPSSVPVPRAVRTSDGSRDDIVAVARALDLHLVYIPSMRNGREPGPAGPEDRGNAILSTLPLSDVAAIELPWTRHRRVAIAATVSGADAAGRGWRMRLVSLHLDTVGSWRSLYLFSSHLRARQARRVIDVVHGDDALVIGADVNAWAEGPAEPAVALFRRALPETPAPRWQPTFQRIWRLDYLFFRLPEPWQAASRRPNRTFGSDHHPLVGGLVEGAVAKSEVSSQK